MAACSILSAYRLDRAGVEYLLGPYSPRCELSRSPWPDPKLGQHILVPGRGWHIGDDPDDRVIVEVDDDIANWPQNHDPQTVQVVQKHLGSKRFGPRINPQTVLVIMYGEPGYGVKFDRADVPGWNMTFQLANTLASWGPTVVDDGTVEGIHHLQNGQWVREGPGFVINLRTGRTERPR